MKNLLIILSLAILFTACNSNNKAKLSKENLRLKTTLDKNQKDWVEKTLSELSVREMAGQVVLKWTVGNYISVKSDNFDNEVKVVESGIGGIWLMGGQPYERAVRTNELQKHAKIPLLVTSSVALGKKQFTNERDVWWLAGGGTDVPPAMAYGAIGDPAAIMEAGKIIGLEARATGLNSRGGPDSDVLMSLDNVLHNRTFSDDPWMVAQLASAYIDGAHSSGLITASGFFPGAGGLDTDPHVKLAIAHGDRQSFDSIHFIPFKAVIETGTDMVITSHFAAPGLTGSETLPATLSPEITRILREDLGYNGILITDAMDMGGITNNYDVIEAAILAFKAGNDIILGISHKFADTLAVLVENGEIPLAQLKTSVRRILELKAKLGLNHNRMVDLNNINTIVGNRTHQLIADSAASRSIVLLRDKNAHVPLDIGSSSKVLSISYEREDNRNASREFNRILGNHVKSVDTERISPSSSPSVYNDLYQQAQNFDKVIFSVYLRPLLGREVQDKMSDSFIQFVKDLQSEDKEVILVSFGELEVLSDLPDLGTFLMAWSGQDVMQRAAAKAILGIKPISGHLPINLLPFHKRGDGLERESTR
jgi:beta-N-acetylhexosaminidase